MNLITVEQAAERYGKSKNSITSTVCIFKREHGNYPKWYHVFKAHQKIRIDTEEYERLGQLERKLWLYATDHLFWVFEDLGISQWDLARRLSFKSLRYESVQSWNTFLSNTLFMIPPTIISEGEKSMRAEFVQLGTRILYDMIKKGEIDEIHR